RPRFQQRHETRALDSVTAYQRRHKFAGQERTRKAIAVRRAGWCRYSIDHAIASVPGRARRATRAVTAAPAVIPILQAGRSRVEPAVADPLWSAIASPFPHARSDAPETHYVPLASHCTIGRGANRGRHGNGLDDANDPHGVIDGRKTAATNHCLYLLPGARI